MKYLLLFFSNIMNIRKMAQQSIIISHLQFNFTMNTFDPTFVPSIFGKICPNFWLQIQTSITFLASTNIMRSGEVINQASSLMIGSFVFGSTVNTFGTKLIRLVN